MTYILVNKSKEQKPLEELLAQIYDKDIYNSPDIHVLDSSEKNSIGIEEVKDFQKEMMYKPFQEKIQVGIIYESEKLTSQAQNALLKTLEESSDSSIYILCVDNEKNLLPTIRSRGKVIYSKISKEKESDNTLDNILEMDLIAQFEIVEKYSKNKGSSLLFVTIVEEIFKERLELDIKNGNIDSSKRNLAFLKIIQESREKISANCNRRLTLESMLMQLNA
jgi:DNA polymerase III delta prime subunit